MDSNIKERIINILKENNIQYTDDIEQKLKTYYEFLVEYNQKVNLTAITDENEVYLKHFADCMLNVSFYKIGSTVCDIGTGAGFPGVVIKIVRPDLNLILIDSLNKRVIFLNELVDKLGLENVKIIHARAEDITLKNCYLNSFDYVVARAVANLTTLTEYCLPYVKVGGNFIAYKSENIDNEIAEAEICIKTLGGKLVKRIEIPLFNDIKRTLLLISKTSKTSNKFPRGQNKPRLQPIK